MPVFLRKCAAVCMAAVLSLVTVGCLDWEEDIPPEEQGNASDTYTLMLYMCASDLESECGFATEDLNEIMYGYTAGNLNVIVQTGGTAEWQNTVVADDRCQRYRVTEDGLELVDDSLGMQNMADSATLTDFIQYCSSNYAADHYGLVLWDHGGGVVGGYGYDENFGGDSMSLTEMSRALGDASVHLDMLGFDACLMANFETCLMAAPYADYLIASEEPEPGCGWYYTDWIGKLSENCGIPPKRYGRQIIDDYITESGWDSPSMYSTLGMFDLQQVTQKLLPALSQFSDDAVQQLSAGEYRRISQSRSNTRAVYQSELDHIDLLDYAQHSQSETADQLEQAVYEFTGDSLRKVLEAGVNVTMIQVGNEVTNGLLWPEGLKPNYDNIARFISSGIRACRAVKPEIPLMIHLDNGGNNEMYRDWFDHYMERGEDFDYIGLSYYPFWHGTLQMLEDNMNDMAARYGKELIVAEVSMGYTMEDYKQYEKLKDSERKGYATKPELVAKIEYPMTVQGQVDFTKDFLNRVAHVRDNKGLGFFWWEPAWIPVHGSGWATPASLKYMNDPGPCGNEWANQALFDYDGNVLPALEVIRDFRK